MRFVRVRPETKLSIVTRTDDVITNLGSSPVTLTTAGVQGASDETHIGTMVSPKLIQLNACFRTDTLGGTACIRWYVVQWLVDDSVDAFTVAKYLDTNNVNSYTAYVNRRKFRTLRKGGFVLNRFGPADVADLRTVKMLNLVIRPRANVYFTDAGIGTPRRTTSFSSPSLMSGRIPHC